MYRDNKSGFEKLLQKDKSVKIHHKNLQVLATEIYMFKHGLSPQMINNVFELESLPYNMKRQGLF